MPKANRAYRRSQDRIDPSQSSGDDPDAKRNRMHMLQSNINNIKNSYLQAKADLGGDCVVFCADASDRTMRVIAERMLGKDNVETQIVDFAMRKQTCTLHFALERSFAIKILEMMTPSGKAFVESGIPIGHFGVVVVQSGGNLYVALPQDSMPEHGMTSWLPIE
jgi:hypothetical protein